MAKKKKSMGATAMQSSGPSRVNIGIEEAENGYTINCSGEGKNGEYHLKRYVAPNEEGAIRIAVEHLSSRGKSKGKKKSGKKKIAIGKKA